jgi:3-hydroxyisobutyrate dehydrogenase-like beta-hydroxyacid dehydrogenase
MSDNKPRIGFIGLGIMGGAMARNAARAGFPVTVTNRSQPALERAKADGLSIAASPSALAASVDAVVVMVTDPKAVRDVLEGPSGLFSTSVSGKTLIQMSTIDEPSTLEFSREAQKHGMHFLDCPVTGSKKQVEAAELILLAGGDAGLLKKWTPFLESVGQAIVHAGDIGKGTALKLCMNLIVAEMTTALCESVSLARLQGVDPARIFDVISHRPALNCGYFKIKQGALLNNDFSPAFSLDNMLKDVRFMTQAAEKKALPLPVIEAVKSVMEQAAKNGWGKEDLVGLIRVVEPKTGAPTHH